MTLITYKGPRGTTYGFRYWYRGRLYKQMVGRSKDLAKEAEKRERRKVEQHAFERRWGSLQPRLTPWAEAVEKYLAAKGDKRSLPHDRWRLAWWTGFLPTRKVHTLQDLDPEDVDAAKGALAAAGKSPATIQRYLAVLKTLCQLAVRRWNLLERNPVLAVDWPKARPPDYRILTPAECQRLLEAADPILRPMIVTALYTGLRKGDILRLTAEDFQARPGWIRGYGGKAGRPVWLPVLKPLQASLDSLGVISGPLWRTEAGERRHAFPETNWKAARERAKLPWVRFHDLRHATGSMLADAGVPQRHIQEFLGHSSGKITERYTRPSESGLEAAGRKLAKRMGPGRRRAGSRGLKPYRRSHR